MRSNGSHVAVKEAKIGAMTSWKDGSKTVGHFMFFCIKKLSCVVVDPSCFNKKTFKHKQNMYILYILYTYIYIY